MGFYFLFLFQVSFELLLNFKCYYLIVSFDLIYRIIYLAALINPSLFSPVWDLDQLGHSLKSVNCASSKSVYFNYMKLKYLMVIVPMSLSYYTSTFNV